MQNQPEILTIGKLLDKSKQYLAKHGIESARLEAEILLCHILQQDRVYLYVHFDQPLEKIEIDKLRSYIVKRAQGEPTAYILGKKNFFNLEFTVNENVLIPRPETELLAEKASKIFKTAPGKLLDLGTGSGALALTILANTASLQALALDVSREALAVAKVNAAKFGLTERVEFLQADMRDFLQEPPKEKFLLLVANPPYVTQEEMKHLSLEVQKEPKLALAGGLDGLDFYRLITTHAKKFLLPQGLALLEIGYRQGAALLQLAEKAGFKGYGLIKDYAGHDRIIWLAGDEFIDADKILAD